MRLIRLACAVSALGALPVAAQKPGDRTATPFEVLGELRPADPEAEVEKIAAEAAEHPLGSLANPVRVGGPGGALAYIARLRCSDGSRPEAGSPGPGGIGAYGSVTRSYPLDCGRSAPGRTHLIVDLYHEEHVENRPAAGFSIEKR